MAKYKAYRYGLYFLARALAFFITSVPRSIALAFGRLAGQAAFWAVGRHRKKTLRHLALAFPQKSEQELKALGCSVFENLSLTAVDFLRFRQWNENNIDHLVDFGNSVEVFQSLLCEGKGVISVTAHLGNWELLAGALSLKGLTGAVLGRKIYFEPYNRWVVGLRMALRVPTLYRDESARPIFDLLKHNQVVGLLPDQDIDRLKGIFVPFFGKPAYTPIAPARISIKTQAPIVAAFLIREGVRYRILLDEIIRPSGKGDREKEAEEMTRRWMKSFETMIRRYPDQWPWMHERWKTQPPAFQSKNQAVNREKVPA